MILLVRNSQEIGKTQDKDMEAIQLTEVVLLICSEVQRIHLSSRKLTTHLQLIPFVVWNAYNV